MRYLHLDHVQKPVSKIALGSTYFGSEIDVQQALPMLDLFAELGGTTLDTARGYGSSEHVIGQWMQTNGMRDQMVVATKGLFPDPSGTSRYHHRDLSLDIQQSQDALQTDSFDIWFLHRDATEVPVDEVIGMLAEYVHSQQIRCLGASNWSTQRIEAANAYAQKHNLPGFSVSEIQWSLASCTPERWQDPTLVCMTEDELQWYRNTGMPLFAFSTQAKGYFSKAIAQGIEALSHKSRQRFHYPENEQKIARVDQLSRELQVSPAAITIAYITSAQPSSVAIVGCSSVGQLADSLTAADVKLSADQLAFLEGR